ncbi:hypothetical protein ACO0LD_09830 [Undibacterium sp. Ji83W]|uniref:hypothetical protein n=1 Tax=Undibacterium sp. Ji83W TaxID=3413043 RepID=UPI003BF4157D
MSDKEIKDGNKNLADVEFEAFLQGGDELALLLRDLPQDAPSAELDAAIMADAEAALILAAAATTPVVAAANDAKNPDASPHRPSFLWRWKTPLGLAASIMLAVPLFLLQQEHEAEIEARNGTQTEEKIFYPQNVKSKDIAEVPPVAIPQAAPMPQAEAVGKIASKDDAMEPQARAERRVDAEMKQAPVVVAAAPAKAPSYAPPAPVITIPPAPAAPAPVLLAEAPLPMPKAVAAGIANEKMPELARHAEAERARNTESLKIAAKEEMPRELAKVAEVDGRLQAAAPPATMAAPRMMARSAAAATSAPVAVNATAAAPVTPMATTSAKPAMDSMMADKKADKKIDKAAEVQDNSQARLIVVQPVQTLAAVPPAQLPDAPDWLTKIEKLLKEKQNQEALEEWKKFRTTYPNFVVDKSLQKKIDALQK